MCYLLMWSCAAWQSGCAWPQEYWFYRFDGRLGMGGNPFADTSDIWKKNGKPYDERIGKLKADFFDI
jgi:hypothetical protein